MKRSINNMLADGIAIRRNKAFIAGCIGLTFLALSATPGKAQVISNGAYYVQSTLGNLFLTAPFNNGNGTDLVTWPYVSGSANQVWYFGYDGSGEWYDMDCDFYGTDMWASSQEQSASGAIMSLNNLSLDWESTPEQWSAEWYLYPLADGNYALQNGYSSDEFLTVQGGSHIPGTFVVQEPWSDAPGQEWEIY
jgi:hypothetical protein